MRGFGHNEPPQSLVSKPSLRAAEEFLGASSAGQENAGGVRAQRSHHPHDAAFRGKRGPANQEPAAGSPRAVRARLRDQGTQQAPEQRGPFAVSRRCSFVERRPPAAAANPQMHFGRMGMDSWEPSCIEPGAFPSVGSAIEVPEGMAPQNQNSRVGHGYGYAPQADEPPHAPRGHKDAPWQQMRMPVPTPVRSMKTQETQTSDNIRHSILRHHGENDGSPVASDGEGSPRVERRVLQENQSVLNSDRSHMTGKSAFTGNDNMSILNTARSVFHDLQYPTRNRFQMSAATEDVMRRASQLEGKMALGQALSCAMNDELADLDHHWGLGSAGGAKNVEARVAACLKKFAKRAEKSCSFKSLAPSAAAPGKPPMRAVQEGTDAEVGERCSQLEDEIAEKERSIASLKEQLQRPAQSGQLQVLSDLTACLGALQNGQEDVPLPGLADIASNVDQCVRALMAANASARHMYQKSLDEHASEQERNREFCPPPASASQEAPGVDAGATGILRGLR